MPVARKIDGQWLVADSITLDRYDFEGSAESLKATIDDVVDRARMMGMVDDGRFDVSIFRYSYDESGLDIKYYFDRVESDLERSDREEATALAKKQKALKKRMETDTEYAEFLRLQAKFGWTVK